MDYREIFKRVTAELRSERKKRQAYQDKVTELEVELARTRAQGREVLDHALQELARLEKKIEASY